MFDLREEHVLADQLLGSANDEHERRELGQPRWVGVLITTAPPAVALLSCGNGRKNGMRSYNGVRWECIPWFF